MGKWRWIGICACVVLCVVLTNSVGVYPQPERQLVNVFRMLGIKSHKYVLHVGDYTQPMTNKTLKIFLHQAQTTFRLSPVSKRIQTDGSWYTMTGTGGLSVRFSLFIYGRLASNVKPYLSIQFIGSGIPEREFFRAHAKLFHYLKSNHMQPHLHFSLQGTTSMNRSLNQLTTQVIDQLLVKKIEMVQSKNFMSISGYSPLLIDMIKTKGGMMNLQIAARVNKTSNQTVVTLGTPIITIEY